MKKVLIVDDEVGIVEEVKEYLIDEGYDVHIADTAKDGIELVEKIRPDVMVLDMKLPDMLGIEVLRVSKKISPNTKVIVSTGYVDQKMIDEAESLGRDSYLPKPFDLERLREEIDRFL
ncbi:MAG: response regulator [Candidatus Omnitrophica bacterium]|nr:response regulator [Candidatus Omnitrophota bacterium]